VQTLQKYFGTGLQCWPIVPDFIHFGGLPLDAECFDALLRDLASMSRRRVLRTTRGAAIGVLVALTGSTPGDARKRKRNKKQRCPSYSPKECGHDCCTESFRCCDDREARGGQSCFLESYHCCPASDGGGACPRGDTCCPPRKGEVRPSCINTGLGEHCCPKDSGGACDIDEACCPSASTNSNNFGCCPSDRSCCNFDGDCHIAAGEICLGGCCF
jgi:hypothetical protein